MNYAINRKSTKMKLFYLIQFALIGLCITNGLMAQQSKGELNDLKIEVKCIQNKTALEIIEILEAKYGLNFSFQSNHKVFEEIIRFPERKYISFSALAGILEDNLPYTILQNGDYIILQKKNLRNTYLVEGTVKDAETSETLVAATVYVVNKNIGMHTTDEGSFSFEMNPGNYILGIRYVGYATKLVHLNLYSDKHLNLLLEKSYQAIDEVKIEGKRQFMSDFEKGRTIETIDSKELSLLPANNATDVLHARISGAWASKTSGAPGDHIKIRIRGISSIYASLDPLYVIDGVPVPKVNMNSLGISDLNINDIESISVLKDASSNAIYGLQGGNGVIIVNTKSGGGKPYINARFKTGVQYFNKRYDFNNAQEFLEVHKYSDDNYGTEYFTGNKKSSRPPVYPEYQVGMATDNWQDEIFTHGISKEFQLNSGGSFKEANYYISGNHFKQTGIVKNSGFEKSSVLVNAEYGLFNKADIQLNYKGSLIENSNNLDSYLGNLVIYQGINTSPVYYSTADSVKNIGTPRLLYPHFLILHTKEAPYLINELTRTQKIKSNSLHLSASLMLMKNLFFEYSGALSLRKYNYQYTNEYTKSNFIKYKTQENIAVIARNYKLKYEISNNSHQLKIDLGYRYNSENIFWDTPNKVDASSAEGYPEIYQRGSMAIFGEKGSTTRRIRSLYMHINYNYKSKYIVSLAGNYDHLDENDDAFAKQLFPSVAISWDVAKEPFLYDLKALNSLELYANWGIAGNYPLNGLARDLYAEPRNHELLRDSPDGNWFGVDTTPPAQHIENLANHHLRPELVTEYNLGTRVSLFNERLIINYNYYNKTNHDLILFRDIPIYYSEGRQMYNIGELNSWGQEIVLETLPIQTKDFSWYNRFNYSMNRQMIVSLNSLDLVFSNRDRLIPKFVVKVNRPIGDFIGYKYIAKYDPEDEYQAELVNKEKACIHMGILYEKIDTISGILNENDKAVIGNSIPDFVFSFHNAFRYKTFQLDMIIYGVVGVDKYNATRAATYMSGVNSDIHKIMLDGKRYYKSDIFYESSYFVEDASFIRLKQVSFSYFPNKKWFGCIPEISITGENLITITRYKGYDPEASIYTNNNFSDNGIDRGAYPIPIGWIISVGLKF